jgi:hypothetical protein
MAIRKVPPYKRRNVLVSAASVIGRSKMAMAGYVFFPRIPMDHRTLYYFKKGCEKLAGYLQPLQTEAQYRLKSAAFDFLQNQVYTASS